MTVSVGTTKTQKLLAASGDFHYLPFWQTYNPSLLTRDRTESPHRRIEEADAFIRWFDTMSPDAKLGHSFSTFEPEEESLILEHCLVSCVFIAFNTMTSYILKSQVPAPTERAQSDVEMITVGAFSPLRGFVGEQDYHSIVESMRLANGLPWSIPVALQVARAQADSLRDGSQVALTDDRGVVLAILDLEERYAPNREEEARLVYGTTEIAHPGVAAMMQGGEVYLGGAIQVLNRPDTVAFPSYHRDPA